jgi:hypothetical protein
VAKRSGDAQLGSWALALAPTYAGARVLLSGATPGVLAAWVVLGLLYLVVLGELRHRRDERPHIAAVVFALVGFALNLFGSVVALVLLMFGMNFGH